MLKKIIFGSYFLLGILAYVIFSNITIPYESILKIDILNYYAFLAVFILSLIFFAWFGIKILKKKEISGVAIFIAIIIIFCAVNLFVFHQNELSGRKGLITVLAQNDLLSFSPRGYSNIIKMSLEDFGISVSINTLAGISRIISIITSIIIFLIICRFINRYLSLIITLIVSLNNKFIYASTSFEISISLSVMFMCLAILLFDMYIKEKNVKKKSHIYHAFLLSSLLTTYCKIEMSLFFAIPVFIALILEKRKHSKDKIEKFLDIVFVILTLLVLVVVQYQYFSVPDRYAKGEFFELKGIEMIFIIAFGFLLEKIKEFIFFRVELIVAIAFGILAIIQLIHYLKSKKEQNSLTGFIVSSILSIYIISYILFMQQYITIQYVVYLIILMALSSVIFSKIFIKKDIAITAIVLTVIISYGLWNSYTHPNEYLSTDYKNIIQLGKSLDSECRLIKYQDGRYPYIDFIIGKNMHPISDFNLFNNMESYRPDFLKGQCFYIFLFDYYSEHDKYEKIPEVKYQVDVLERLNGLNCKIQNRYDLIFESKNAKLLRLNC